MTKTTLRKISFFIVIHTLGLALIFTLTRLITLLKFADQGLWSQDFNSILRMFNLGIRFDLRFATIATAPLYLLALVGLIFPFINKAFLKIQKIYTPLIYFLALWGAFISYYYFKTFYTNIDVFVFGLINDDTQAVFASIFSDYPLIRIFIVIFIVTILSSYVLRFFLLKKIPSKRENIINFFLYLMIFLVFLVGLRGSLGTFPLREANAQVSQHKILNQLTPNAFISFEWAFKNYKRSNTFEKVDFKIGKILIQNALNEDSLMKTTSKNDYLKENPPHVVLNIMESFAQNMLAYDDPQKNDLLASLRPHFENDFTFKRFLPDANGTAPSLAYLLFSSPEQTITQGLAKNIKLAETAFSPFKKQGYKIVFITSGNLNWRNFNDYLKIQGVDITYDQNSLLDFFKNIKIEQYTWGVADEYAFKKIFELLKESKEPLFIVFLSTTNHSPHIVPKNYQAKILNENKELASAQGTFQYANNALGDFISQIKDSDLAANTIIAATGDHQMRNIKVQFPKDYALNLAVPFYLYVPSQILNSKKHHFNPLKPGSHKDIMPTLFSQALSETAYYSIGGRDLLAVNDNPDLAFAYNEQLWMDEKGVYLLTEPPCFYAFDKDLIVKENCETVDNKIIEKIKAYQQLLIWQINLRVAGEK